VNFIDGAIYNKQYYSSRKKMIIYRFNVIKTTQYGKIFFKW